MKMSMVVNVAVLAKRVVGARPDAMASWITGCADAVPVVRARVVVAVLLVARPVTGLVPHRVPRCAQCPHTGCRRLPTRVAWGKTSGLGAEEVQTMIAVHERVVVVVVAVVALEDTAVADEDHAFVVSKRLTESDHSSRSRRRRLALWLLVDKRMSRKYYY